MSSLAEIRAALADAVRGKGDPALLAFDYPPGSLTTPCAVVEPEEVDFRARDGGAFRRGSEAWTLSIFVLVIPASAESAARITDAFFDRSANDLKDAIEGIEGMSVEVTTGDRWGEYPVAGQTYQGFRLTASILN